MVRYLWQRCHANCFSRLEQSPRSFLRPLLAVNIGYIIKILGPKAQACDIFYEAVISLVQVFNVMALQSMKRLNLGGELQLKIDDLSFRQIAADF